MAELQKNDVSAGELAQRFVEFVMIQAQNILYLLGQLPGRQTGMPADLEAGKMMIDQLEMIGEKTKGNLSKQETAVLENALKNVRLAFVTASGGTPASMMPSHRIPGMPTISEDDFDEEDEQGDAAPAPAAKPAAAAAPAPAPAAKPPEPENKKKFTKTYG